MSNLESEIAALNENNRAILAELNQLRAAVTLMVKEMKAEQDRLENKHEEDIERLIVNFPSATGSWQLELQELNRTPLLTPQRLRV